MRSTGRLEGDLDALSISGELLQASALDTRFDQADPRIAYEGSFATANSPSFTGGSLAYSTSSEATISLAFDGTAFELVSLTGPRYGIANVSVDGAAPFPVDLYSAGWLFGQKVFALEGLAPGTHTLTISRSGLRNPSAVGDRINLDAVWVRGTLQ